MIEPQRILCPIDLSPFSRGALAYAASMAHWYRGQVTALHVTSPRLPPLSALEVPVEPAEIVRRFVAPIARTVGVSIEVIVREGDAAEKVLACERELAPDLLCLGTHGLSLLEQRVLGSVADVILRATTRPALAVHQPAAATPSYHPLPFGSVLVGVDFSEGSTRALEHAYGLAREGDARLVLVHVLEEGRTEEETDEAERAARRRLRDLLPQDAGEWCLPQLVVTHGFAENAIPRLAAEWNVDLIVMGAQGHHGKDFGGKVLGVLGQAPCPVLILPSTLRASRASRDLTDAAELSEPSHR
jgi:nucleotide-binding universal stress UspA family protein